MKVMRFENRRVQKREKREKKAFCKLESFFLFLIFFHYSFSFALQRWSLNPYNGGISPGQKWWQTFWNIWGRGDPRVFPIAPCFDPICFAQSPPLLTYIAGPKGMTLHLSIDSSIISTFFGDGPIKLAHCQKRKKRSCPSFGFFFFFGASNLKNSQQGTSW
jgi:hypothetical protein